MAHLQHCASSHTVRPALPTSGPPTAQEGKSSRQGGRTGRKTSFESGRAWNRGKLYELILGERNQSTAIRFLKRHKEMARAGGVREVTGTSRKCHTSLVNSSGWCHIHTWELKNDVWGRCAGYACTDRVAGSLPHLLPLLLPLLQNKLGLGVSVNLQDIANYW